MQDFPTIVYKCPGDRPGPPGTTYQSIGVADAEALEKTLKAGWFATLPEAAAAFLKPAPPPVAAVTPVVIEEPAEDAPPTRDEMLAKAAEIGLTVDKRWADKTLANKIIEALEAQEAELLTVPEDKSSTETAP